MFIKWVDVHVVIVVRKSRYLSVATGVTVVGSQQSVTGAIGQSIHTRGWTHCLLMWYE